MCKQPRTLTASIILLALFFLVSPSLATYTIPTERPNCYFPSLSNSYISFSPSILPMTFSDLHRDTSTYWHFNQTKIRTTTDMTVTAFNSQNWTNYTVASAGTQQIYNGTKPTLVQISGLNISEESGWTYAFGTITVTVATTTVSLYWGYVGEAPPVPANRWQMSFTFADVDANDVTSRTTWKLYNGTQLLTYTQGAYTLLDGTFTLKIYYHSLKFYERSLPTASFGNTTVSTTLYTMKKHLTVNGGGWIVHDGTPETGYTLNNESSLNLTFTHGAWGFTFFVIDVPSNATFIALDGVNLTSWTYDHDAIGYYVNFTDTACTKIELNFLGSPPEELGAPFFIATVTITAAGAGLSFWFYRRAKKQTKTVPSHFYSGFRWVI